MPAHHGKLGPRGVAARHTHAHGRLANATGRTPAPCDSIYVTFSEDGRKRCHTAWGGGSQGLRRGQDLTREGGSFRSAGGCVPPPVFPVGSMTLRLMARNGRERGAAAAARGSQTRTEVSVAARKRPPGAEVARQGAAEDAGRRGGIWGPRVRATSFLSAWPGVTRASVREN